MRIEPTIGRVVYYFASGGTKERAAFITDVNADGTINVFVLGHAGGYATEVKVELIQDGDAAPIGASYCGWMPYQVGQAKRHAQAT